MAKSLIEVIPASYLEKTDGPLYFRQPVTGFHNGFTGKLVPFKKKTK